MSFLTKDEEPIVALCSPVGAGALAIIRLSGNGVVEIVDKISKLQNNKLLSNQKTHTIHFGKIFDHTSNSIIDDVLFFLMKAPKTFTGQDCIEISCHNNPFIIKKIIELCISNGARAAENGEFSKRAFLNGKIDLIQAESINELIAAQNEVVLKKSLEQLKGSLSSFIKEIEEEITKLLALVEASFEFLDEEQRDVQFDQIIKNQFDLIFKKLEKIKENYSHSLQIKEGLRISLLGSVNVGKSTLFNALIKKERSIVTDVAGTTRDSVEAGVCKDGNFWTFIDTAGLRKTENLIEQQGIERSLQEACSADILLLIISAVDKLSQEQIESYKEALEKYREKIILVLNKIDLQQNSAKQIISILNVNIDPIKVSAITNAGIKELENKIQEKINIIFKQFNSPYLLNKRHFETLTNIENKLKETFVNIFEKYEGYEIAAMNLKDILETLSQLTGKNINEQTLDSVFKNFCIGK
ncbi:TPA: tRNA uridine-5-carboxymethylaminomethyl(34) synthesis GTPase MnmE [Candidatus Dependentiae bacterium]|nr:MAG: tRNA modification GTPase MnmE [candidate division TM6 bacterium GW2011_GWE2_31_21]KKP53178.1 MAG: tRNA modification GTPase MnmE [candidate division TM6 bacterium GW2011_GWF2_33_332]HBS47996.1 tRNA uridine-5-carboxymethylaminomethyl(34) synthesis GTPase MnmE [Candidatus Dependentiae bacterium]HBZ73400.1 tRNA uridine-5-carboxymethylaminomethyl(34) synthesis GTPase MnmE [Candidatus Dependentiae bacterium]